MNIQTKTLVVSSAISGILSGTTLRSFAGTDAGLTIKVGDLQKMSFRGKDGCKGKGGCKSFS